MNQKQFSNKTFASLFIYIIKSLANFPSSFLKMVLSVVKMPAQVKAKLLWLSIILVVSQSCQTVIDIDQKEFKKRLVLTSTLDPAGPISVFVTRSVGALATGYPDSITNAVVDLYEDGNLLFSIPHFMNGNYQTNYQPLIGKTYKVTVTVPGFDNNIEATTTIPTNPMVDTFNYAIVPNNNNWGGNALNGSITINDPAGENYYMLEAYENYTDTSGGMNQLISNNLYISTDDPLIGNNQNYNSSILFTDFSFNGTSYKINFNSESISNYGVDNHLLYIVHSLSKETYLYLVSLQNYQNNNGNPFAEPVQVYSNVSSQMGILGAETWQMFLVY